MEMNTVLLGDCRNKLRGVASKSVDLVYLDPPFFSQVDHKLKTRDNSSEYVFSDKWPDIVEYREYIRDRILECRRVLKSTGSIFLHCDRSASHHLRLVLDEVFGSEYFQSEIIWSYRRWSNAKKGLLNSHQTIYFYSVSDDFKFNSIYTDYSPTTNVDQILQERRRNENGKSAYKLDINGDVVIGREKKGVPLSDVWEIPYLNPKAKERVGYPTQKPILLLERIIRLVTDEGDLVLDPFCGSGTALVAAHLMGREYIGVDISEEAVELSRMRLQTPTKTASRLMEVGSSAYFNQDEETVRILQAFDATPVQRNSGIDGFLKQHLLGAPVAIRIQKETESFDEARHKLISAATKKGCAVKILVRTKPGSELKMFQNESQESGLVVLDSYEYAIEQAVKKIHELESL